MNLYDYFYNLVMQIPPGRVSTYGALAKALGDIRASRACGVMLSQNPDPPRIPCHRVVMSDGSLGGFTHPEGVKRKIELLKKEGVEVKNGKIVNFTHVFFDDFKTEYPLKALREEQEKMRERVLLDDDFSTEIVGGVDISYEGRNAYGALVVMKEEQKEIITKKMRMDFPYIPTYLAFREAPLIGKLIKELSEEIILLIDGNGIIHPKFFGLASHVGVEYNLPTVGVAKSKLLGEVKGEKLMIKGKQVGWFVKSGRSRGIYISPGHKVSMGSSLKIVKKYLKYKNPEPLRLAHIYANKLRRGEL